MLKANTVVKYYTYFAKTKKIFELKTCEDNLYLSVQKHLMTLILLLKHTFIKERFQPIRKVLVSFGDILQDLGIQASYPLMRKKSFLEQKTACF